MTALVKELVSSDGLHKVEIYRRNDDTFGFEEFQFSKHPDEMCWIVCYQDSYCIVASVEDAEREARGRVAWPSGEALVTGERPDSREPRGRLARFLTLLGLRRSRR